MERTDLRTEEDQKPYKKLVEHLCLFDNKRTKKAEELEKTLIKQGNIHAAAIVAACYKEAVSAQKHSRKLRDSLWEAQYKIKELQKLAILNGLPLDENFDTEIGILLEAAMEENGLGPSGLARVIQKHPATQKGLFCKDPSYTLGTLKYYIFGWKAYRERSYCKVPRINKRAAAMLDDVLKTGYKFQEVWNNHFLH